MTMNFQCNLYDLAIDATFELLKSGHPEVTKNTKMILHRAQWSYRLR